MRTPIHLLAIAGLGFVLGTGHALVRTLVLDEPAVRLTRAAQADTMPAEPEPATPEADAAPGDADATPTTPEMSDPIEPVSPLDIPVKQGQITMREAHELFQAGAFFLDARSESDFNAGHIEGSFWMPASRTTTSEGQDDLNFIPPGDTVVIYCTGGDCDASENTANRLELLQYDFDIKIMGRGYVDWLEADLPVTLPESDGEPSP